MSVPDFTTLTYRIEEAASAAVITLDRPERRNAFTTTMCLELVEALDVAEADDAVRSIVLTGAGSTFCAGADLDEGFVVDRDSADEVSERYLERAGRIAGIPRDGGGVAALRIAACTRPVIGAINGAAVGVGATMTLPMDVRIASERARFGFVFARRGLVPEGASSWFLPRVVGISRAMEWVATGRLVGAEEALAAGLVSRCVPDDQVLDEALVLATEIAASTSPVAVSVARQMMWGMLGAASPWDAHRVDSQAIWHLVQGPDVAEGVASFVEKRPPAFTSSPTRDFPGFVDRFPGEQPAD